MNHLGDELEERQQDELNSISSIYGDIFRNITPQGLVWNKKPCPHFQVSLVADDDSNKLTLSLVLDIEFTPTYPLSPPIVKILQPKNLLKSRINALKSKIDSVISEYPKQEVSFTIISDIKLMLDEYHANTDKPLSLEEERELRIRQEREKLEQLEAKEEQELELEQEKRNAELDRQIRQIRDEYSGEREDRRNDSVNSNGDGDEGEGEGEGGEEEEEEGEKDDDDNNDNNNNDSSNTGIINETDLLIPSNTSNFFVFDNVMYDTIPEAKGSFKFRAVSTKSQYTGSDLLSSISTQYLVTPYLNPNISQTIFNKVSGIEYLLTEIDLIGDYWLNEMGKRDIQSLESDLQHLVGVSINVCIARLYGFQIDKIDNKGWRLRLLTEFSSSANNLQDILSKQQSIDWAVARAWLIQLLPALESLHNMKYIHKFICPLTIFLFDTREHEESFAVMDSPKVLKLTYPLFGHKILSMYYTSMGKHSRVSHDFDFYNLSMPPEWIAPELQKPSRIHQRKTDVWELGVLFIRIMFGIDSIPDAFKSPTQFYTNFNVEGFSDHEEYIDDVHDLLSKMLRQKLSKRPTPLELNATKFLRDGPILTKTVKVKNGRLNVGSEKSSSVKPVDNEDNNEESTYENEIGQKDPKGRYERDFEEVGRIGKGGFGEVVKARNRMEGTFYAIKKVKHRMDKLDTLLSEVLSLARLNHQYIVRYYGTWVENVVEDEDVDNSDDTSSEEESDYQSDSDFSSAINRPSKSLFSHNDNSFQVDFISNSFDPNITFGSVSEDEEGEEQEEEGDKVEDQESESQPSTDDKSVNALKKQSILYIQMEFCENNTLLNLIEQGLPKNPNQYWRLFRQLLEAVSYIHEAGFIHRDLKPTNIFIDKGNNIKVGDFGLAKNSQFTSALSNNNQLSSYNDSDLSTVVGTLFYNAKEVASGNYDEKVDMYSLGIIFFEMCYPLSTGMERAKTLNNLRLVSVEFPNDFIDSKYRLEKKVIRLLLDHDPIKRPGAVELLQSGWMPVEHQDQVIKEALKSLADPASPWQQQVRETLFNQNYSLAQDLLFDGMSKKPQKLHKDYSSKDYLMFSNMIGVIFGLFKKHGAIEEFNTDILFPKSQLYSRESVYEVLDKSGAVLNLPYDLLLPFARFLSRNNIDIPKIFRHDFVYRPNLRGSGTPEKFSVVNFDIVSKSSTNNHFSDGECIKVVEEVLMTIPCFTVKGSHSIIMINHYDIIDAIITFSFGNIGINESSKYEVMEILSQLGIDRGVDEVKRYLKEEYKVPHTVTNDLIDLFNFTVEPEKAKSKLQKLLLDSPLLVKVERAMDYIMNVLSVLRIFDIKTMVYFNPLSNYNCKYYNRGLMFQALFKLEKVRKFSRIATGGRYDNFIKSLSQTGLSKNVRNHAVGFSLSTTYLFLILKNFERKMSLSSSDISMGNDWKQGRCNVLVTSLNKDILLEGGAVILKDLWDNNISSDILLSSSQDDYLERAQVEGINWVIILKYSYSTTNKKTKKTSKKQHKSIRVKDMTTGKDNDIDSEEVIDYIKGEIDRKDQEVKGLTKSNNDTDKNPYDYESNKKEILLGDSPLFSVEISQKPVIVNNEAPRGRKSNKGNKWEIENDSIISSANLVKSLATASVLSIDVSDEVLDAISSFSIKHQELWLRKIYSSSNNIPKTFALNIYNTLVKESAKGSRWMILYSPKTGNNFIVDLHR